MSKTQLSIDEYQQDALRTYDDSRVDISIKQVYDDGTYAMVHNKEQIINGLMGLNGEAGEALDILKKHLFQGHDLDEHHLALELGDVAWYLAVSADAIGYSLTDILKMNIEKRRERYPEGFDAERSKHRKETDI